MHLQRLKIVFFINLNYLLINMSKTNKENKKFGLLFFLIFLILGLWPLLNKEMPNFLLIGIALIFLILVLLNSKILSPLNKAWIKFGEILGKIIAPIVMALIFFLILTPIGLIMKILRKDILKVKFIKNTKSYWIKRSNNIGSMNKQF